LPSPATRTKLNLTPTPSSWYLCLSRQLPLLRSEEAWGGDLSEDDGGGGASSLPHDLQAARSALAGDRAEGLAARAGRGKRVRVLMRGELEKRGEIVTAWRKRHFVLHSNGRMEYFDGQPNGREMRGSAGVQLAMAQMPQGVISVQRGVVVTQGGMKSGRAVFLIKEAPGKSKVHEPHYLSSILACSLAPPLPRSSLAPFASQQPSLHLSTLISPPLHLSIGIP
jgi:hypothetical protein